MVSVLRNAAFLAVAKSFSVAIYALLGLVLPRYIPTADNGVYALMTTLLFFGGLLATFGVPTVVTRSVARAPGRAADVHAAGRSAMLLGWVLSVAALSAWMAAESAYAGGFEALRWVLFGAVVVILLADALGSLGESVFQGMERMAAPAMIEIGTGLVRAGGAVACMLSFPVEQRLPAIFACFLLGSLSRAILVARLMKRLKLGAPTAGSASPRAALALVRESLYLAIFRGLRMIRNRVDLLLLGVLFVGTTGVAVADPDVARGVYGQAMRVVVVFHVLTQALLTALWPRIARLTEEVEGAAPAGAQQGAGLEAEYRRTVRWQAWWAAPLAALLWLYSDVLAGLFGPDYLYGVPEAGVGGTTGGVLRILLLAVLLDVVSGPIGMVMMGVPRLEKKLPLVGAALAGTAVLLNLILIPRYGILGAAYASLGSTLVEQLIRFFVLRSVFGSARVMLATLPYVVLTAAMLAGLYFAGFREQLLLGSLLGGAVYLAATLAFRLVDPALLRVARRVLNR